MPEKCIREWKELLMNGKPLYSIDTESTEDGLREKIQAILDSQDMAEYKVTQFLNFYIFSLALLHIDRQCRSQGGLRGRIPPIIVSGCATVDRTWFKSLSV